MAKKWQRGSYGSPIEGSSTLVLETLEDGREDDQVRRLPRKSTFRPGRFLRESGKRPRTKEWPTANLIKILSKARFIRVYDAARTFTRNKEENERV